MLVCSWLLSFIILSATATPLISKYLNPKVLDKDMNITLKPMVDENEKAEVDAASDNTNKLVNKVKSNQNFSASNNNQRSVTFSDFIQRVIKLLNKFEDTDIEDLFSIANEEIKKYHYRGSKFHELTENLEFRKFIAKTLDVNKQTSAADIRNNLQIVSEVLKDDDLGQDIKNTVDSINSLYKDDSNDKFNKFLTNLDDYRQRARKNIDLVKITRAGIRSIIFDHYSRLDHLERSKCQSIISEFLTHFTKKLRSLVKTNSIKPMNEINKIKNRSTLKTNKQFKKKSKTLPSGKYRKMFVETNYDSKYNVDHAIQTDDVDSSKPMKLFKLEPSKQSLQIPWDEIEHILNTNDTYEPNPSKTSQHNVMEVITMRPYVSKRAMTSQKFKYEILFKHDIREPKLHLKKPEFQIKHRVHISKPNEGLEIIPPVFSQSSVLYPNKKKGKIEKLKRITKNMNRIRFETTSKHKKVARADQKVFNQKYLIQNRKSFDNISMLHRLQYLEDELRLAQTQIKNDSKIIKDLNNMLANQKTKYNFKFTEKDNNDKSKIEEKKDVVIDLKLNYDDLKKIVSVPFNGIKQDEIKTALLKKLNIENHDVPDSNIGKQNIVRKFDFDQRTYNSSKQNKCYSKAEPFPRECNEYTLNKDLSKPKNNTEVNGYSSPVRSYLSDGDTYERVEERLYDSDSNKVKINYSDKDKRLKNVKKQSNYEDVTVSSEIKKTTVDADTQIFNKNDQNYHPQKNQIKPYIDEKDQHILSSGVEIDSLEKLRDGIKTNNELERVLYEPVKYVNDNPSKDFDTRTITRLYDTDNNEYKKQKVNENDSDKENDNINHNNYSDRNGYEKVTNYGQNAHNFGVGVSNKKIEPENSNYLNNNKRPATSYPNSNIHENNIERNERDSKTNTNQKLDLDVQSNEPLTTKGRITKDLQQVTQKDEEEIKIENENAIFFKTENPSGVHPKRFSTSSPQADGLIGSTDAIADNPMKILKFAKRIP